MTLCTHIYITGNIAPEPLLAKGLLAICQAAGRPVPPVEVEHDQFAATRLPGEFVRLATALGQGLPAWTGVHYSPTNEPFTPPDDEDDRPSHTIELNWDTGYSYRENGMTCSQLHAAALLNLADILPAGITFVWRNEYTGEIHPSDDLDAIAAFART